MLTNDFLRVGKLLWGEQNTFTFTISIFDGLLVYSNSYYTANDNLVATFSLYFKLEKSFE